MELRGRERRNFAVFPPNRDAVELSEGEDSRNESYGARVVFCEPTEEARETACADVIAKTGATLIHSFENPDVIAGQGTAVVELLEDFPDLDLVMCPVGGGGLLSGTAIAAKSMRPNIRVIAAEPENADDAAQSFRAGRVIQTEKKFTIADGLRTNIGEPNFAIIKRHVDDIVTVSEKAIISAMRTIWETVKIIVEPSAAVPFAAIQDRRIDVAEKTGRHYSHRRKCRSRRVAVAAGGIDDSGGLTSVIPAAALPNLDALPWISVVIQLRRILSLSMRKKIDV